MRGLWITAVLGVVVLVAPSVDSAKGQTSSSGTQTRSPAASGIPPLDRSPDSIPDPLVAMMEARRVRSLATDRQKKIVDDIVKLQQLAAEVNAGVDKTEVSPDVIHKTEEIERLAHDVKQRMKG